MVFKKNKIEVTENVRNELVRIKKKNKCDSINDTIIEMIKELKEYQNE